MLKERQGKYFYRLKTSKNIVIRIQATCGGNKTVNKKLERIKIPQKYMNSVYLIFLLVSIVNGTGSNQRSIEFSLVVLIQYWQHSNYPTNWRNSSKWSRNFVQNFLNCATKFKGTIHKPRRQIFGYFLSPLWTIFKTRRPS